MKKRKRGRAEGGGGGWGGGVFWGVGCGDSTRKPLVIPGLEGILVVYFFLERCSNS